MLTTPFGLSDEMLKPYDTYTSRDERILADDEAVFLWVLEDDDA